MENNEIKNEVQDTPTTEPTVDYKALYEKLQKDNANLDKYNKDLKAKYQAKLTDEERQRVEQEELKAYYKQIERENKSIKLKSELSKINANNEWVDSVADMFLNDDIYGGIQKFGEYFGGEKANFEKKIQEQSLLKNPTPPPADAQPTGKKWKDMTMADWNKLKEENPAEYKKFINSIK